MPRRAFSGSDETQHHLISTSSPLHQHRRRLLTSLVQRLPYVSSISAASCILRLRGRKWVPKAMDGTCPTHGEGVGRAATVRQGRHEGPQKGPSRPPYSYLPLLQRFSSATELLSVEGETRYLYAFLDRFYCVADANPRQRTAMTPAIGSACRATWQHARYTCPSTRLTGKLSYSLLQSVLALPNVQLTSAVLQRTRTTLQ